MWSLYHSNEGIMRYFYTPVLFFKKTKGMSNKGVYMKPVIRLKSNKLDKGLTLLEIIISMGIALVAILTMLIFFAYALVTFPFPIRSN